MATFRARRKLLVGRWAPRRWRRVGQPVPTGGAIPAVGECDAAAQAPNLALVDVATGVRRLWSLEGGSWRETTPLRGVGGGPTPGGPVGLGSTAYLPVIDATTDPWRLSVYLLGSKTWTLVAGGPLNQGIGHAQGVIRVNGTSVWAAWQENAARADGRFDTRMYVQRVAPTVGTPRTIWTGVSIGPGSIETVQSAGRRWVLYMPSGRGGRGLTVAVKPLR